MWRDALLVGGKDLRVELRSKVAANQVGPFALVVLILFAFALDPDRNVLQQATPGLFWVAVVLSALLAAQRSVAVETAEASRDTLRLSGLDPAGIFLGKAGALYVQLIALQVLLGVGVAFFYGRTFRDVWLLALTCLLATGGIAAAGVVYGLMAAGLRVRETLLPLLILPVLAPVLLAATRAWEAGLAGVPGNATSWLGLLAVFCALYVVFGVLGFEAILEAS